MTQRFDVCNGDADGLCAALQWRLHEPAPATLLTALKRDIALLEHVHANGGDEVNVFDLSMHRNRAALLGLLGAGVRVRYFDHHAVGDIPSDPLLEVQVDCASDICTSLLVDRRIDGAFRAWALVGAYDDNLAGVADELARRLTRLFLRGPDGLRPAMADAQEGEAGEDAILFHEYFHGDTGRGLGAAHQTGWTALVTLLL